MTRVFNHGGLRLVLLSLLEDGPKHGYELILALEERFMGMYRPSSGTVYPRLAALEEEGLITGTEVDGKRSYALTDAGREELVRRRTELDETVMSATSTLRTAMEGLQAEIRTAVAAVQAEVGHAVAEARRGVAETVRAPDSPARQAWRRRRAGAPPGSRRSQACPARGRGPAPADGVRDPSGAGGSVRSRCGGRVAARVPGSVSRCRSGRDRTGRSLGRSVGRSLGRSVGRG